MQSLLPVESLGNFVGNVAQLAPLLRLQTDPLFAGQQFAIFLVKFANVHQLRPFELTHRHLTILADRPLILAAVATLSIIGLGGGAFGRFRRTSNVPLESDAMY